MARGKRKKADADKKIPCILEPEPTENAFRKNWARLIQKIYEVDPLICSRCNGPMKVISFIGDEEVIRKILKHPDLWDVKSKAPPRANAPPPETLIFYDDSPSPPRAEHYLIDPDYAVEAYL